MKPAIESDKEKFKSLIRALGFEDEQIPTIALILRNVRKEPGINYWRFSGTIRPAIDRLVSLDILQMSMAANEKGNLYIVPAGEGFLARFSKEG